MPDHSRGDEGTAAAGRAHGAEEVQVDDRPEWVRRVSPLVPHFLPYLALPKESLNFSAKLQYLCTARILIPYAKTEISSGLPSEREIAK